MCYHVTLDSQHQLFCSTVLSLCAMLTYTEVPKSGENSFQKVSHLSELR